jgi:hypothetical protein
MHSVDQAAEARPVRLIREDVVSLHAGVNAEAGGRPLHQADSMLPVELPQVNIHILERVVPAPGEQVSLYRKAEE